MRQRNKPWAKDKMNQYPQYVISNPEEHKGNWSEVFGKKQPLHIEIGTGKGRFITGMAKANPNINYLGIELAESVIVSALEKLIDLELPNVKLLNVNAGDLEKYFS
ncbi:MAG TPA: methyltransferase, partial [Pseudoneobacillus sp.]|nr:methyltransferase [Pseudoneobacillus sp.]